MSATVDRLRRQKENVPKSQSDLIYERQRRGRLRFGLGVQLSYLVLFALLLLLFSGLRIEIGGVTFRTIELDGEFIRTYGPLIAQGVPMTILLAILSISLASLLALLGALGRLSKFPPAYALATFYISLIRGTPLYLQILFFFLALPQIGIVLTGLWAGVLALGLNYGAYMTEIMRAGIQSVGVGQREAALAIGMTPGQVLRRIVLPQAFRVAIPPIGNEFIAMLKDTSLVAATGFVWETLWWAQRVGRGRFRNLEALLIAAIFYWIITIILSAIQNRIEARLGRGERGMRPGYH